MASVIADGKGNEVGITAVFEFIKAEVERRNQEWRERTSEEERCRLLAASCKQVIQSAERVRCAEVRAQGIIAKAHEDDFAVQLAHMRLMKMCGIDMPKE